METLSVEREKTVRSRLNKITYTWDEYLQVIRMMDEGNQVPDDFEVVDNYGTSTDARGTSHQRKSDG